MKTDKIKYCALTTISLNMRSFMMPAALYLAKNGYDVTIGCKRDESFAKSVPADVTYLPLDIERGASLKGTLVGICQLYHFFRKNKIQMVEYGTENVSFCASIASWLAGVPIRIYNHWGARYVGYPKGVARSFSIFIEKTCARLSTVVRQASEMNRKMCIEDGIYRADKVKVLGYGGTVGVDFSRFDISKKEEWNTTFRKKYGISKDDFVYGDICWVRRDKGSSELISAFRRLNRRDAWLVFVGDIYDEDPVEKELLDWARTSDRVIFTGRVLDVEHYVAGFNCLVHPSYREGLGMVLQEAGAVGVPCITTNIPGAKEFGIPGKTGLLVNSMDTDDLLDKMKFIYQDREKLDQLSVATYEMTRERYERGVMLRRILEDRTELFNNYLVKIN